MHFAARYAGKTYREFAAVWLISDPYRETSAFGARIFYPEQVIIHNETYGKSGPPARS